MGDRLGIHNAVDFLALIKFGIGLLGFGLQWITCCCSCGRVVKATDSKSVSLWERRFESYQLRDIYLNLFYLFAQQISELE